MACFSNVARLVKDMGGIAVMGWLVDRTCPEVVLRIHHCVWQTPTGEMVDVTPQENPEFAAGRQYILWMENEFEPDPSAKLVNGSTQASRSEATLDNHRKWVSLFNQSELEFCKGNIETANQLTEQADRERAVAYRIEYIEMSMRRYEPGEKPAKVEEEHWPYLEAQG